MISNICGIKVVRISYFDTGQAYRSTPAQPPRIRTSFPLQTPFGKILPFFRSRALIPVSRLRYHILARKVGHTRSPQAALPVHQADHRPEGKAPGLPGASPPSVKTHAPRKASRPNPEGRTSTRFRAIPTGHPDHFCHDHRSASLPGETFVYKTQCSP